ncbi:hypothetical protein FB567DRAFT_514964 [Paraphoma chrysanthemicola]|uniref:Secreted protein n=1 Tax=Paraphoma chrysanthemicola TaxID=798071 RepID=A0A8K0W3F0_9PLEO|nr:hypothetical protein FB567DRAFT_514964 [Paraphoma chrysanthemicola]
MKIYLVAITIFANAFALPSSHSSASNEAETVAFEPAQVLPSDGANCQPGLRYCYGQIVQDLKVNKQTILHQYCDQRYEWDALSCHACKKFPWPLDYCWDGPGAWNSVFECKGGQQYTFKERCNWCQAGKCV